MKAVDRRPPDQQKSEPVATETPRRLVVWSALLFAAVSSVALLAVWLSGSASDDPRPTPREENPAAAPASTRRAVVADTLKVGEVFTECGGCPEMIVVAAGSFVMGSPDSEKDRKPDEGPQHQVIFANPFAVGRFAVTVEQWKRCVEEGGCPPSSPYGAKRTDDKEAILWNWTAPEGRYQMSVAVPGDCNKSANCLDAGHPVVGISIGNVQAYLTWLSAKTGSQYRLPSEAEREYATRAGTTTPYYTGDHITKEQANFCEEAEPERSPFGFDLPDRCAGDIKKVTAAGRFGSNAWGLFDVHGNIYEYTADCIHLNYVGAPSDGSAWTTSCVAEDPVLRGGSFLGRARNIRSAARHFAKQEYGPFSNVGFRVVRSLAVKPASAQR